MQELIVSSQSQIAVTGNACLPAMTQEQINKVEALEHFSRALCEQEEIPTEHLIHGGMYSRTIQMPKGTVLTGALLKLPTVLVVAGDCAVFIGEETIELRGYSVLPGSAGRKQAFLAHTDVSMTIFYDNFRRGTSFTEVVPEGVSNLERALIEGKRKKR